MHTRRHALLGTATAITLGLSATWSASATPKPEQRPDLADLVAGAYNGDVTSDARGSSRSGVRVSVVRIGPNLVKIMPDYPRIPSVEIPLQAAMSAIIAARGNHVFLMDRAKSPNRLDLTIDDAAWVGYR